MTERPQLSQIGRWHIQRDVLCGNLERFRSLDRGVCTARWCSRPKGRDHPPRSCLCWRTTKSRMASLIAGSMKSIFETGTECRRPSYLFASASVSSYRSFEKNSNMMAEGPSAVVQANKQGGLTIFRLQSVPLCVPQVQLVHNGRMQEWRWLFGSARWKRLYH